MRAAAKTIERTKRELVTIRPAGQTTPAFEFEDHDIEWDSSWLTLKVAHHGISEITPLTEEMNVAIKVVSHNLLFHGLRGHELNSGAIYSSPLRVDQWERALFELTDLQDGLAPVRPEILRSVERLLPIIRLHARLPSFEVDEEDGSVTMRWKQAGVARSFALAVVRPNTFIAVLAEPGLGHGFSTTLKTQDEGALVKLLEGAQVARLVK